MLLISSIIKTVLPTPAPPKSPTFPPLEYGAKRSITLIPVVSSSVSVDCSENSGAGWCIGLNSFALMGPFSSTGSPTTFNILPNVGFPTGTDIGDPTSSTTAPLTSPSELSMAIVLTVFSPRC